MVCLKSFGLTFLLFTKVYLTIIIYKVKKKFLRYHHSVS